MENHEVVELIKEAIRADVNWHQGEVAPIGTDKKSFIKGMEQAIEVIESIVIN